jgi:hypothetical protein
MPKSKVDKQKCPEISSEVFNSLVSVENQNTEAEKNMDLDNMPGESSQAKNMHTLIAPNEGQVSEIIALKMEDETLKIVKAQQTLPGAGDDRISKIIENQKVLFAKQTEDLALLNQRYLAAEMKVQLIKLVPVMVTRVPTGPVTGVKVVMVGTGLTIKAPDTLLVTMPHVPVTTQ